MLTEMGSSHTLRSQFWKSTSPGLREGRFAYQTQEVNVVCDFEVDGLHSFANACSQISNGVSTFVSRQLCSV